VLVPKRPDVWERDRIGTFLAFLEDRPALYAPGATLEFRIGAGPKGQ